MWCWLRPILGGWITRSPFLYISMILSDSDTLNICVLFFSTIYVYYYLLNKEEIKWFFAGVFYCGAPAAVAELRHLAHHFSHKTNTKFEFHKENF